jgi:HipA-like C-terminal domain
MAAEEKRGKRAKVWVVRPPDGTRWLRKEALASRPFELAIEVSTLRLARAAGLSAPESSCCQWTAEGVEHRGTLIRSFITDPGEELAEGAEVLKGHFPEYDPEAHWTHTPQRVLAALAAASAGEAQLLRDFARLMVFDAWIGNGDRHPGNWGVLRHPNRGPRLAPIYDTAACLGAELTAGHPLVRKGGPAKDRVSDYITKCPSGFGVNDAKAGLVEVVQELRSWAEWRRSVGELIPILQDLCSPGGEVERYFRAIPAEWLTTERAELAIHLLGERCRWLAEMT